MKPSSPEDIPTDVWTKALGRRAELEHALEIAEIKIQQLERRDTI